RWWMRFPLCTANGADHGSGRTVCSEIAATTQPPFGAVSGLIISCPCWPCAAPSMGVAWAGGGGSWSAPSPGSVSFAASACGMTSGPTSTRRSSRSGARWFAGSRCGARGRPPERRRPLRRPSPRRCSYELAQHAADEALTRGAGRSRCPPADKANKQIADRLSAPQEVLIPSDLRPSSSDSERVTGSTLLGLCRDSGIGDTVRSPGDWIMRGASSLAVLLLLSHNNAVRAQSPNASLTGRVTDSSKAVIVDATVAAVRADTNTRRETATNASGDYFLTNLPPGRYRIEVEKPGFKKLVKPDVILNVQDAIEIDFELAVGWLGETVTIEVGASQVNPQSGTVSTVVDRTFVETLPLNGRSFQTLIMLTPGVVVTPTVFNDQGQFSVNGQRADANYFTVDGVSANFGVTGYIAMGQAASGALPALAASGGTNSLVSVEAMQEFRIQTSSVAPEFGRTPGGQVAIVTRSGTNDFHGTAFEYFRDSAMDAKDWFVNNGGLPKPASRQHNFGGVLGGPVIRDKTFM